MNAEWVNAAFDRYEDFSRLQLEGRGHTGDDIAEAANAIDRLCISVGLTRGARAAFNRRIEEFYPSEDREPEEDDYARMAMIGALVVLRAKQLEDEAKGSKEAR
jgi:hypothetical protein